MTAQSVPLTAVPAQTLAIVLEGQNCQIAVYTLATGLYFDLTADDVVICRATIARNQAWLLLDREYLGFVGDFIFLDTQGVDDPEYTGLGSRWVLVYESEPPPIPAFLE